MMLVSFISYIDRNTLALLAPTILQETGMSGEEYGFIISAFSVLYMAGNPIWGRILDRVGLRVGMTAAVSTWTLASVSHAFAGGFTSFAVARAALGFGEGATFPGGLRAVMQTLPPHARGRGVAVAYSGGSLGAMVTPLIVTPIALWWGWRSAFWFTGLIGVGWLLMWSFISRRPDVRKPPAHGALASPSPRFRDPQFWAFVCAYALGALPLGFVLYQGAIYLHQALGKDQAFIGKVLWLPPLGWEVGYFAWGWLADRVRNARLLLAIATVLTLPLAAVPWMTSAPLVLFELFFAMFVAAGFVIVAVAYATQVYSSEHAGLIAGVGAGSWGACVALAMPLFGRFFDQKRYDAAFLLAASIPVIGYLGWLYLTTRRGAAGKPGRPPAVV
jgi:ACS family hexuronate transporter-like MFS transporter